MFFNFIPHARYFIPHVAMKVYTLATLSMSFTVFFRTGTIFFVTISHVDIPPKYIPMKYSPLTYTIPAKVLKIAIKIPCKWIKHGTS